MCVPPVAPGRRRRDILEHIYMRAHTHSLAGWLAGVLLLGFVCLQSNITGNPKENRVRTSVDVAGVFRVCVGGLVCVCVCNVSLFLSRSRI